MLRDIGFSFFCQFYLKPMKLALAAAFYFSTSDQRSQGGNYEMNGSDLSIVLSERKDTKRKF